MAALYSRLEGDEHKPLPSLPSPTLTNPDLVLPDDTFNYNTYSSPARTIYQTSAHGYLRDKSNDHDSSLTTPTREQQRERRGLMSRKMMLVRSQTGSSNRPSYNVNGEEATLPMASSPLLHDSINVVSADGTGRRGSNSSIDSEEMAKMPDFLQKYRNMDLTEDEMTDAERRSEKENNESRRAKEEEEQVSALLSKRAEEILANAKKRLNLMEGNLRGARDLVAPLTAANLKRATSLSHSLGSSPYAHRRLDSMGYDPDPYNPSRRMLQAQASSPTMRYDYAFGQHNRNGSDFDLERPHTSMSRNRFPIRTPDGQSPLTTHNPPLRSARSHDSLGLKKLTIPQDTRARSKNSPESSLEPVSEDDGSHHIETSYRNSFRAPEVVPVIGLGLSHAHPSSTASTSASGDFRDQMASLKGRISTLRDRAREDSVRRASASNLRESSPFNNASNETPDMWYNESSRSDDSHASGSPAASQFPINPYAHQAAPTRSRNAFAELAARQQRETAPVDDRVYNEKYRDADTHKRTPSGTAIVDPANTRFTHFQQPSTVELPGAYPDTDFDDIDEDEGQTMYDDSTEFSDEDNEREPDVEEEIDEDDLENPEVVAHEDREDAFDYEHFFLHSAMGSYNAGRMTPDSDLSETSSVSSSGTARAPAAQAEADTVDYYDDQEVEEITQAPGTPDALRKIEARLQHTHERGISTESLTTLNSFVTANEDGNASRSVSRARTVSRSTSRLDLYDDPSADISLPGHSHNSTASRGASRLDFISTSELTRPGTATREPTTALRTAANAELDDASDRADSGVGGLAAGRTTPKPTANATSAVSAPSSPATSIDPTAAVVKALLDPAGKALSTKDTAMLSTLIESLRRVCVRLQEEDQFEGKVLRRRLEDARRVLDGLGLSDHDA